MLKSQLEGDPICDKIRAEDNDHIFHRRNKEIIIKEFGAELSFYSNYSDDAYLLIKGDGIKEIQILTPQHIKRQTETEIIVYPSVRFIKKEKSIEVYFVALMKEKREWLIYKN